MEPLKIIYDSMVYFKIMHWVMRAKKDEVSGFGKTILEKNGVIRVVDAIMLPQRNGAGHTDIEAADLGKAEFVLKDTPGELRLWWHSHVQMPTFWSAIDMATIELLGKHGWFLATVFNQHWNKRSAIFDGERQFFIDDIATSHIFQLPEETTKPWDAEFDKNVKAVPSIADHYKKWRGEKGKKPRPNFQPSKREKKIISSALPINPVIAIFETKDYGKVIWTKQDESEFKKLLTPKDKPHVMVEVRRWELFQKEQLLGIRWASPWYVGELADGPATFHDHLADMLGMNGTPKKREALKFLPGTTKGTAIDDKSIEEKLTDEALRNATINNDWEEVNPTDAELERYIPGFATMSEENKQVHRDMLEAGDFDGHLQQWWEQTNGMGGIDA